jgi:hypothetical protein
MENLVFSFLALRHHSNLKNYHLLHFAKFMLAPKIAEIAFLALLFAPPILLRVVEKAFFAVHTAYVFYVLNTCTALARSQFIAAALLQLLFARPVNSIHLLNSPFRA